MGIGSLSYTQRVSCNDYAGLQNNYPPKMHVFGKNAVALGSIDAILQDQFAQVVYINIYRSSNLERPRFALDKTPKWNGVISHTSEQTFGRLFASSFRIVGGSLFGYIRSAR